MPTPTLSHPSFRLNTNINSGQHSAAVAGLSDGRFVAVWRDLDAGSLGTLKYAIFNADGSVAKSEAIANLNTTGTHRGRRCGDSGTDRRRFRNHVGSAAEHSVGRLPPRLQQFGHPRQRGLAEQSGRHPCRDQRHPDIAGDGAGGFYVVWEDTESTPA